MRRAVIHKMCNSTLIKCLPSLALRIVRLIHFQWGRTFPKAYIQLIGSTMLAKNLDIRFLSRSTVLRFCHTLSRLHVFSEPQIYLPRDRIYQSRDDRACSSVVWGGRTWYTGPKLELRCPKLAVPPVCCVNKRLLVILSVLKSMRDHLCFGISCRAANKSEVQKKHEAVQLPIFENSYYHPLGSATDWPLQPYMVCAAAGHPFEALGSVAKSVPMTILSASFSLLLFFFAYGNILMVPIH